MDDQKAPKNRQGMDSVTFIAAGIAVLSLVFAVGAVAIANAKKGTTAGSATGTVVSGAPAGPTIIEVTTTDFKYTPKEMSATEGEVIFRITNKGTVVHTVVVVETKATSPEIPVGTTQDWSAGVLPAGTYNVECNVAGHKDAGMTGILTVAKAAPGTATAAASATTAAPTADATSNTVDWLAIDKAHQKAVQDFLTGPPAGTKGHGGDPIEPKIENGIKVFELETKVVQWEVAPGKTYEAWTYNGAVPGPEIIATQGETFKVRIKNSLPESTTIHWHGLDTYDNKVDGVSYVTQDPIVPGQTYTYTLKAENYGPMMYHSHHAADAQVPLGLMGTLTILPKDPAEVPEWAKADRYVNMQLMDGPLGFGINGKGFPATDPVVSTVGEKVMINFSNEGLIIHPMHLHGHHFWVVGKDGEWLPAPYKADTLNIAPGEIYSVIVDSKYKGVWAFHCHILTHAESDQGLHGMTTVWVVS